MRARFVEGEPSVNGLDAQLLKTIKDSGFGL
jgi:hypothetical protein